MYSSLERERYFPAVADAALEEIGMQVDPTTMVYEYSFGSARLSATDVAGLTDAHIWESGRGQQTNLRPPMSQDYVRPYLFQGLLRDIQGVIDVPYTEGEGAWEVVRKRRVSVQLYSSPGGINAAQAVLGRQPGVDAFRLERHAHRDIFEAADWVEGFADLTIPIAGLHDLSMAFHDVSPMDHVQGWIITPTVICQAIAHRATAMRSQYGERMYDSAETEVQDVIDDFVAGLDGLQEVTRQALDAVTRVSNEAANGDITAIAARKLVMHDALSRDERSPYLQNQHLGILQKIGLVSPTVSYPAGAKELRKVMAMYARSAAELLLQAEEAGPDAEVGGVPAQAARIRALVAIRNGFEYADKLQLPT